jgi:hypothetical protein
MYAEKNFKTKKALKDAVAAGQKIGVYNPSGMFPVPLNGRGVVEGPHYPEPHKWYAQVEIANGYISKVK